MASRLAATTAAVPRSAGRQGWVGAGGMCRACARAARGTNRRSTSSVASRQHSSAKGAASSSHAPKPGCQPLCWRIASTASRCAPAPSSEAPADSRITVGSSKARARGKGAGSCPASSRHTGSSSAARPEVEGSTNAVAATASVRR